MPTREEKKAMTPIEATALNCRLAYDDEIREKAWVESVMIYTETHYVCELHDLPDPDPLGLKSTMAFFIYRGREKASDMKVLNKFTQILDKTWEWDVTHCALLKRSHYEYPAKEGKENRHARIITQLTEPQASEVLKKLHDCHYDCMTQIAHCRLFNIAELDGMKTWEDILAAHERDENKLYFFTSVDEDEPLGATLKPFCKFTEL